MAEDEEIDIARFLLKLGQRNGNEKRIALPLLYRANSTAAKSLTLRIIYNLRFEESNFWFDIYSFISLLLFN